VLFFCQLINCSNNFLSIISIKTNYGTSFEIFRVFFISGDFNRRGAAFEIVEFST